jgi:opacity protein-like surface antigen
MNYKSACGVAGLALAGAMTVSASASAADLGRYSGGDSLKDAPYTAATWAGGYVGGHLGASWTDGDINLKTTYGVANAVLNDTVHKDLSETSVSGGAHVGYNWQRGGMVYGLEGGVSFADSFEYLASFRGRVGVASGNWLLYGAGGLAVIGEGPSDFILDKNGKGASSDKSNTEVGFVVGGGAELKLNRNWSVGVEGLYYGFNGNTTQNYGGAGSLTSPAFTVGTHNISEIGVVQARVSYHFSRDYEPLK